MTDSLSGARVALLEARRESELASLVRRHGGVPVSAPALAEIDRDCTDEVTRALDALASADAGSALFVLATGVGLDRFLRVATGLGRGDELRLRLSQSTLACRGPKPLAVLKREGLDAQLRAPAPHTTAELLALLEPLAVRDRVAVYVHDGGTGSAVPDALSQRGARVCAVQPYIWGPPADPAPLQDVVRMLADARVDALAITTQAQVRYLFEAADALGQRAGVLAALQTRVCVAAVGPTCARALTDVGAPPHVVPAQSKMGPLVLALAAYLAARRDPSAPGAR